LASPFKLVLDPFAGSGTTIIAAQKTGRQACALEIDPSYTDVIVRRWQMYTGKPALLETTEETFEEVSEHRKAEPSDSAADDVAAGNENGAQT
jgi:tRNA G10  N-methylase Trm11